MPSKVQIEPKAVALQVSSKEKQSPKAADTVIRLWRWSIIPEGDFLIASEASSGNFEQQGHGQSLQFFDQNHPVQEKLKALHTTSVSKLLQKTLSTILTYAGTNRQADMQSSTPGKGRLVPFPEEELQ